MKELDTRELYMKACRGEAKLVKRSYVNHGTLTRKVFIDGILVEETTHKYPTELVLISDYMPDDTKIQIESWDGKYAIGAYPIAKEDGWNELNKMKYPQKGRSFRCQYNFDSKEEAESHFDRLKQGIISLRDIADKFDGCLNKDKLAVCLGY